MRFSVLAITLLFWLPILSTAQDAPGSATDFQQAVPEPANTTGPPVRRVRVINFPDPQNVTGSVEVNNFPATQTIDGTVAVSNFPAAHSVTGTVTVDNLPTDENGAIRVTSSVSECDCSTDTLVVQMVDEYRLGLDEEFVTEQIDLLNFYGGQLTVQLVVLEEPNANITVSAHALWTIGEDQPVAFEDPDGASVQLTAASLINSGSDIVVNQVKGRFLKIRLKVHGNGATASVHIMAIR